MFSPSSKGADLLERVIALATTDMAFRARLLEDPSAAVRDQFGVHVPSAFRVKFIEKPAGLDALIVLPDPVCQDGELDDDDLDLVAGGTAGCVDTSPW